MGMGLYLRENRVQGWLRRVAESGGGKNLTEVETLGAGTIWDVVLGDLGLQ